MRKVISPVSRQVFLLETSLSSNILSKKTDILCEKTFLLAIPKLMSGLGASVKSAQIKK